jgi:hypothetical protein
MGLRGLLNLELHILNGLGANDRVSGGAIMGLSDSFIKRNAGAREKWAPFINRAFLSFLLAGI